MTQSRQPKGVPVGGQYAANSHDEAPDLMPGYTYSQHDTDMAGNPFTHMSIGETKGAISASEEVPLRVRSFRFEGKKKIVSLTPSTKYDDWDEPSSRAAFLAQKEHMLATVERVRDHRDWLRSEQHPMYVVTLTRSVTDPLTEEREIRTLDVEFINPRGIPNRTQAIQQAVEESVNFREYEDAEAYFHESGKEYEDAMGDYAVMQERDENLRAFLGDDYPTYVLGTMSETIEYRTEHHD